MDDSKAQNSRATTTQASQNENVSYEHSAENLKVTMPGKDQQVVVHAIPGQKIEINGADPSKLAINILGADVIMSDPVTNAKIVFLGLGLILFSPQEAPSIFLNDVEFMPQDILSKVGLIRNITQKDYLSFTSLSLENIHDKKDDAPKEPEVQVVTKIQEVIVDISPKQTFAVEVADEDFNLTSEPRPDFVSDTEGVPAVPENLHKKNNSQSASETETETQTQVDVDDSARTSFDFDLRLLQVAQTYDGPSNTTWGGGASAAGAFDPSATSQFSTETIDLVSNSSYQTVYADNNTYFSETQAARVLEFSPNLPDAFEVTSVVITGLPSGVSVYGATYNAGADSYTLTSLTPNARGDIEIYLVFATDGSISEPNFTLRIDSVADYNPASPDAGPTPPADLSLDDFLEQDFEIKAATSTADLDPTDGVFDLSTLQNENRILLGNGGSMVYGSSATDTVVGGTGDDTIRGGGDDDSLDGGGGLNDTISFNDKSSTSSVVIDLTSAADGNGFRSATIGTETDSYKNFENIAGGAGADQLLGDSENNILDGGAGDDYIMGRGGNDTLSGGADIDTVDYSYAGNGITITLQASGSYAQIVTGSDTDTLSGFENLIATDYADTITGSTDNNVIDARAGADLINSSTGNDDIDGGAGTDTINYSTFTSGISVNLLDVPDVDGYVTLTATGKADRVKGIENITGTAYNDSITGDSTGQILIGNDGDDTINGDAGDDIIYGGYGQDSLSGGSNFDTLHFDDLASGTNDTLFVYLNTLTAEYFLDSTGVTETDIFSGFESFVLTSGSGTDGFYSDSGSYTIDGGTGTGQNAIYYSSAGGSLTVTLDSVTANSGTVSKSGTWLGTDTFDHFQYINGGTFNDSFVAGNGSYGLYGDLGTDSLTYGNAGGSMTINLQTSSAVKSGTWSGTDTISSFETVTGSNLYADTFFSNNTGTYTLSGGADGGSVVDTISYAGLSAVQVNLDVGTVTKMSGTDTISSFEYIIGTSSLDTFYSGTGTYTLDGGVGADQLNYSLATGAVTITMSAVTANSGTTTKSGTWSGTDTFISFSSFTGTDYVDNVIAGTGTMTFNGGVGADTITYASAGGAVTINLATHDVIKSGTWSGTDTVNNFQVFTGSDAYADTFVAQQPNSYTLNGGAGAGINDSITYAGLTNAITVDLIAGSVTKSGGTDTISSIENITGTGQNDSFTAGNGSYTLDASTGADSLTYASAGGAVTINLQTGSAVKSGTWSGSDTISNFETITGSDAYSDSFTATATGNYTLNGGAAAAVIDSITYAGLAAISVDLNATLTITKSGGTDTLTSIESIIATSNNDTFNSNTGSYTFDGGAGTDSLVYAVAGGVETVVLSATVANSGTVTKSGAFSGTDTFSSIETITTGTGNDSFTAGTGTYTLNAGSGTDSITYVNAAAAVALNLGTGVVTKTTSGAWTGTDTLTGFETFTGGSFNDTFTSASGTYTLFGGSGTDTVTYAAEDGLVTVDLSTGIITKSGTWTGTDTISSIETIIGTAYNDSFSAATGSYTLNGSGGSDTISYLAAGGTVSVNLTTGSVSKSGTWSGTDTLTSLETIYGSTYDDTFTAGTGSYDLRGNAGNDTLTYINAGGAVTVDMAAKTVIKSGTWSGTDTYTNMEIYVGGSYDDAFTAADGTSTINGAAGTDSITYGAAGGALTINLQTGAVVKSGTWSGTDTISNFETITGSSYADAFTATGTGNYTLNGGAGGAITDTITYAGLAAITATLGATVTVVKSGGTDTLSSIESITGTSNNDNFISGTGTFTLSGGAGGTDVLRYDSTSNAMTIALSAAVANSGTATKSGTWSGTDTFTGMDSIIGSTGNDAFTAGIGTYTLDGAGGTDSLTYASAGGAVSVNLSTGSVGKSGSWSGTDTISNFETITGSDNYADAFTAVGTGTYTLNGGAGAFTDTITYAGLAAITATLGASVTVVKSGGTDTLTSIESITGTSNNDTFNSGTGTFTLSGGAGGIDILRYDSTSNAMTIALSAAVANSGTTTKSGTWSGTDTFTGMDSIIGSTGNDAFTAGIGTYTLNGAGGTDSLTYASAGGAVSVNLSTGSVGKSGTWSGTDTISNFETITGSDGYADTFTGTDGGNYTLNGGAGAFTDTITYAGLSDGIAATLGATVTVNKYYYGDTDTLSSIESITGTAWDDYFAGGTGTFTLAGGAGTDDVIDYGSTANAMTIALSATTAGSGTTTKSGTWSGTDNFSGIDHIVGSLGNDSITAGTGSYILEDYGGTDSLTYAAAGGALTINLQTGAVVKSGTWSGTDTIYGIETITGSDGYADAFTATGTGNYTLNGGAGAFTDTITYAGLAAITATLGATVTVVKSGGTDTLSSIETITGTSNNDTFNSGTGTFTLYGSVGTDTLSYGSTSNAMAIALSATIAGFGTTTKSGTWSGADTFYTMETITGGTGNDAFTAGTGSYTLNGNTGTDSITYSAALAAVAVNLTAGTVTKTTSGAWTGTDTISGFETITGSSYNDTFIVNAGNFTLDGGNATDTITYAYTSSDVSVTMAASGFYNVSVGGAVKDSIANFENFTSGSGNDTITGNTGINFIYGGAGNDTINGGGGTDYIYGESGNDIITTTYLADGGADNDIIYGAGSSYLNITLGTGDDTYDGATYGATGGADIITGSGIDTIYGGSGDEIITDSTGDDWYAGGTNAPVVIGSTIGDALDYSTRTDLGFLGLTLDLSVKTYGAGYARVTLNGLGEYDYVKEIETFVLSGEDDSFYGDSNNNIVYGGAGNDIFVGRGGDDYFEGETGNDTANYSSSTNGIQITLGADYMTISDNGGAAIGTDTIYGTESVVGSNYADIFRGLDTMNDQFDGKSGNDIFYVNGGTNTYIGGAGTDTVNYSGASLGVTGSLTGSSLQGGFTTQYSGVSVNDTTFTTENYVLSGLNDNISFDNDSLNQLYLDSGGVDFGAGTDMMIWDAGGITASVNEGVALAAIFSNLEEITITNLVTDGANPYDIDWTEVQSTTGSASGTLTLHVDSGFNINVNSGGAQSWAVDHTYTNGSLTLIVDVAGV